jgi:phage gpG-like protein
MAGLDAARARAEQINARLRDLSPPIQTSSVYALAQAQGRIEAGGPGWEPTLEESRGTSLNRNGALLRSLTRGSSGNLWQDIPHGLRVGTSMETDDGYNIGRMMQYGTGIYGRGTPIKPLHGKFLVFTLNGKKIFAHEVKGSPRRPFLYFTNENGEHVLGVFASYLRGESTS